VFFVILSTYIPGGSGLNVAKIREKPNVWIPEAAWLNMVALSDLQVFKGILDKVRFLMNRRRGRNVLGLSLNRRDNGNGV